MQTVNTQHSYAVIGLGITGLSCVRFLLEQGITPLVCDTRQQVPGIDKLPACVEVIAGDLPQKRLLDMDMVVVSPGVPLTHPVLARLAQAGVPMVGDIELFTWYATAPIVAITGSNGKSTVTTMLGQMAEQAELKVAVGGNIGVPALDLLKQNAELYILELSSFQLETTRSLRAAAATVLNISEDHMDRYADLSAYTAAKQVIYHGAECCVVNADDFPSQPENFASLSKTFSIERQADYSLEQDTLCLPGGEHLAVVDLPLVGKHNYANALAAFALADAVNIPRAASITALRNYRGLAHRCQLIATRQGIRWINDSKATNVGATLAAIHGLADQQASLWLIVGGDSKQADLSELPLEFAKLAGVVAFGKDKQCFKDLFPATVLVDDLPGAVAHCAEHASQGAYVLLSPACASLDMYKNFEDRGQHFTQLVAAL